MRIPSRRPRVALLVWGGCLVLGCGPAIDSSKPGTSGSAQKATEESLESARRFLLEGNDRANNSLVTGQLNAYLAQNPTRQAPALTDEIRTLLTARFGLHKAEFEEVNNPRFTPLDAAHMDLCFLMRDGLRGLETEKMSPAERAATAFAWVMRQVIVAEKDIEAAPPEFVLRRGWGTTLERGYVFLAALHQLGIPGCFLSSQGKPAWACGALVEVNSKAKQILVFDHRHGVPLPGGKASVEGELTRAFRLGLPVQGAKDLTEIATLAAVRERPALVSVLRVNDKLAYDVTEEDARSTRVELAVSLSALAPRMRGLQDDLLPPTILVRLAVDARSLVDGFESAPGVDKSEGAVTVRGEGLRLQRQFLPEGEGGTDRGRRKDFFLYSIIPVESLPAQVQNLEGEPQAQLLGQFLGPFVNFTMERNMPRDLVLRSRHRDASEALTRTLEETRALRSMRNLSPEVAQDFDKWVEEIKVAFGDRARAEMAGPRGNQGEAAMRFQLQMEAAAKKYQKSIALFVGGAAAEPRRLLAMFLQAASMQEQAEQAQRRLDALTQAGAAGGPAALPGAKTAAEAAWKECAGWWSSFLQEYGRSAYGHTARLGMARAQEALGRSDQVRDLLNEAQGKAPQAEQLVRHYLSKRVKP